MTRATRFWIGFGRSLRSCSAPSENSQAQVMLDAWPWLRLSLANLLHALADLLRFCRREDVVGIDGPLRLHENAVVGAAEHHKISLLHLELVEDLARDDHLPALAHAADAFLPSCGCLAGHGFRLADRQRMSIDRSDTSLVNVYPSPNASAISSYDRRRAA